MSDYKGPVIFHSEPQELPQQNQQGQSHENSQPFAEPADPIGEAQFDSSLKFENHEEFVPMTAQQVNQELEMQTLDEQIVQVIRPRSRKPWLFTGLITGFAGLVTWQSIDSVIQAYQQSDWLTLGWAGFISILALLGVKATVKELWKLRRLRKQISQQQQAQDLLDANQHGHAQPFCQQLAQQAGVTLEHVGYDRWTKTVNLNHSDADVLNLYDAMVISQQDRQAKKVVATYATESAALVAISPLALADMLLVAWRNFKMIDELGKVYGVELGYWSRIRLMKLVFINMAAAGASELAVDVGSNLMSLSVAGKISTKAAQGIGVGILTGRLGIKAMALLRPLPWRKEQAVRLGEIRKLVVSRVLGKEGNND